MSEDAALFHAEMEADISVASKKPEYWGLTMDQLKPVYKNKRLVYYLTRDNLRFPPVEWRSSKSGKIFHALPQYTADGTAYNKLYFRDNDDTLDGIAMNDYTLPTDKDL
jgi:hypothetical protein